MIDLKFILALVLIPLFLWAILYWRFLQHSYLNLELAKDEIKKSLTSFYGALPHFYEMAGLRKGSDGNSFLELRELLIVHSLKHRLQNYEKLSELVRKLFEKNSKSSDVGYLESVSDLKKLMSKINESVASAEAAQSEILKKNSKMPGKFYSFLCKMPTEL